MFLSICLTIQTKMLVNSNRSLQDYAKRAQKCIYEYICETGRSFKLRIGEHRNNFKHYVIGSAIVDHTTNQKHAIDFESGCVIYPENGILQRRYTLRASKCLKLIPLQNLIRIFKLLI